MFNQSMISLFLALGLSYAQESVFQVVELPLPPQSTEIVAVSAVMPQANLEWQEALAQASFQLTLSPGQDILLHQTSRVERGDTWTMNAKIQGSSTGYGFFHFNGEYLTAKIHLDDQVYHLMPKGNQYWNWEVVDLRILDQDSTSCIEEDTHEEDSHEERPIPASTEPPAGNSTIDVIVIYSENYASQFSNDAGLLQAEVDTRIAEANQIYQNSGIGIDLVLLHHQAVDMPDNLSSGGDVDNYSIATQLREDYGADLVAFWNVNGSAGSAQNYSGSSSNAYSTAKKSRVQSGYTFVHEIGHNMGAKHDRQTYIDQGRGSELTQSAYKYGLSFDTYRSVMSYDNCSTSSCDRIMNFTNPDVLYQGVRTGIPVGETDPANNARRLNDTRATMAQFRTRQISLSSSQQTSSSSVSVSSSVVVSSSSDVVSSSVAVSSSSQSDFDFYTQVQGSADDGEEIAGVMNLTSSDLELVEESDIQTVGVRFAQTAGLTATSLSELYIDFTVEGINTGASALEIQVELSDSCNDFTSTLQGRSLSQTTISWSPSAWTTLGEVQRTPDLTTLWEELSTHTQWSPGSAICFVITGTGTRQAESYDGNSSLAPKLQANFDATTDLFSKAFSSSGETLVQVDIYNSIGELVLSVSRPLGPTDFAILPSGVYQIRSLYTDGIQVRPWVQP